MKTILATQSYRRKHISFFLFMMLLMLILVGKIMARESQLAKSIPSRFSSSLHFGFPSGTQIEEELERKQHSSKH